MHLLKEHRTQPRALPSSQKVEYNAERQKEPLGFILPPDPLPPWANKQGRKPKVQRDGSAHVSGSNFKKQQQMASGNWKGPKMFLTGSNLAFRETVYRKIEDSKLGGTRQEYCKDTRFHLVTLEHVLIGCHHRDLETWASLQADFFPPSSSLVSFIARVTFQFRQQVVSLETEPKLLLLRNWVSAWNERWFFGKSMFPELSCEKNSKTHTNLERKCTSHLKSQFALFWTQGKPNFLHPSAK